MADKDDAAMEARTARGRIAAAAANHGWREMFDDVVWNVRIYERSGRTILVGYREAGAVTGATRMYATPSKPPRRDRPIEHLRLLDGGKADTVLGWLAE
jgi:hypothetical protein